jgi:hypothetical protein
VNVATGDGKIEKDGRSATYNVKEHAIAAGYEIDLLDGMKFPDVPFPPPFSFAYWKLYPTMKLVVEGKVVMGDVADAEDTPDSEKKEKSALCKCAIVVGGGLEVGLGSSEIFAIYGAAELEARIGAEAEVFSSEASGEWDFKIALLEGDLRAKGKVGIKALKLVFGNSFDFPYEFADYELLKFTGDGYSSQDGFSGLDFSLGDDAQKLVDWLDEKRSSAINATAEGFAEVGELLGFENPYDKDPDWAKKLNENCAEFEEFWSEHRKVLKPYMPYVPAAMWEACSAAWVEFYQHGGGKPYAVVSNKVVSRGFTLAQLQAGAEHTDQLLIEEAKKGGAGNKRVGHKGEQAKPDAAPSDSGGGGGGGAPAGEAAWY